MNDTVERVHEEIEQEVLRRHSNRVLHGHPSPTLWLERDVPVAEILEERARTNAGVHKRLLLYVGTPFCLPTTPDRCGFCLFPSEIYRSPDQLTTYLGYLAKEGELYGGRFDGTEVAAIYFGGGTTNLYRPQQYFELLRAVRRVFPRVVPDAEITVEGVGQLFTQAKLEAMKEAGVTRISMGIQQLDPELLKLSGRKQDAAHVLRMLEACHTLGLRTSVDLIYGWPRQSVADMLRDLDTVVESRVPHITHYDLNVAGRTDFARNRRAELPSIEQTLKMYQIAKLFLEANGYRQITPHDWERADPRRAGAYAYETLARSPFQRVVDGGVAGHDIWGWGFAGISVCLGLPDAPGRTFMNAPRVEDYYRRLDERRFPVERGFHYAEPDLRLYTLFQMLQGLAVDRVLYRRLFGVDPLDEHQPIWQALVEREWALFEPEWIRIVGNGGFYIPLIQGLLSAERLEVMRRARASERKREALFEPTAGSVS